MTGAMYISDPGAGAFSQRRHTQGPVDRLSNNYMTQDMVSYLLPHTHHHPIFTQCFLDFLGLEEQCKEAESGGLRQVETQ